MEKKIAIVLAVIAVLAASGLAITGQIIYFPGAGETSNMTILDNILKNYSGIQLAGENFLSSSQSTVDVFNELKAKGINAQIMVGNIEKNAVNFTELNHTWVLAEVAPSRFLALETAGGRIVYESENPLYYTGFSFNNSLDFENYVDLAVKYNSACERRDSLPAEISKCAGEYDTMRAEFNTKYGGQPVSNESVQAQDSLMKKVEECNALGLEMQQESQNILDLGDEISAVLI